MITDDDKKLNADITYIKSIMLKAEIGFEDFKWFFLFLTAYSFISGVFLGLYRSYIYSEELQTGDIFNDIFVNTLRECVWKLVALIPILVVILIFHQKAKEKNQSISLWLFGILSFVLVFCGAVLPVAATAVCVRYEVADLFSIMTSALCILLCGIFTDNRLLKNISYIYMAIPMIILSFLGIVQLYYEYKESMNVSYAFVLAFGYIKMFSYVIYPAFGYCILYMYMRRKNKGVNSSEL